jgi:SAM-dependent methyltransferase
MDEIAKYNARRWDALARSRAVFTRPRLDLDARAARDYLDPKGLLGEVGGKDVLCLAGGGGQQSAAFALLGARVVVLDISEEQLRRDAEAAAHFGVKIETRCGDMRDLSRFAPDSFDIIWQPYSINFVPEARAVFGEVARVARDGATYYFNCANPFLFGLRADDWDGRGYPLKLPYLDGVEVTREDESWVFRGESQREEIRACREYRHTLGALVGGLIEQRFVILDISEQNLGEPDAGAKPGSSEHFTSVAPPWLNFWSRYRPDVLAELKRA